MLYGVPQALRAHPPLSTSPTFTRQIRIKSSNEIDPHPPEGHILDRKDQQASSLDPQAQNAKSSMGAPSNERSAYVHDRFNKGDVTGGASTQGNEEAAAPGWWERLKQLLGIRGSSKEAK